MSNNLFDNRSPERTVLSWLNNNLAPEARLRVASAYFSIYAFESLKTKLCNLGEVQFLFGDPDFLKSLDPTRAQAAFELVDKQLKLSDQIRQNPLALECADWIRDKVQVRKVRDGRLAHGKLYHLSPSEKTEGHALFQMREAALMGSSNFTKRGIGAAWSNNIELNMVVQSDPERDALRGWFDDIWKDNEFTVDVKTEVLGYLEQLARDNSPEWAYYFTLWHLFRDRLAQRQGEETPEVSGWRDSQIFNALYSFQKHGANGAIHKLLQYNGCILADSVGLGKTFEALAAIKYFELRREKVLVLCPKKLRENWTLYQSSANSKLNPFPKDDFRYTLLSHTDLSREKGEVGDVDLSTLDWSNYGLVVIDESHNFRNNAPGKRDANGEIVRRSRYQRLIQDVIGAGVKTRVLLLSATPVNTDLRDLRNQIYLMSAGKVNVDNADQLDSSFENDLGIPSLNGLLVQAQREFNAWATPSPPGPLSRGAGEGVTPMIVELSVSGFDGSCTFVTPSPAPRERGPGGEGRNPRELLAKLPPNFFTLLDELSIARSREHIRKFYQSDLEVIGQFPERQNPISFSPDIDLKGLFPTYDKLHDDIEQYQLALFKPSMYLKPEFKAVYEQEKVRNFSQESRENFLIGMMKVNYLKRLESSVQSFEDSMRRTIEKIEDLENRIAAWKQYARDNPEYSAGGLFGLVDEDDEEAREAFEVTAVGYQMAHLRLDDWLKDLKKDKQQLHALYLAAKDVDAPRDAKLHCLKTFLRERHENPATDKTGKPNAKVLIFTAYADTARYLYENLNEWAKSELGIESGLVVGSGKNGATWGDTEFNAILTNFSPVSKKRGAIFALTPTPLPLAGEGPRVRELDLLIATDCISEGQNLQDCGTVVNYDVHWNPVRLIQRFGRVDRLGSLHHEIQMVNFWPTEDLNRYINLKHRVEARMALVDLAGTSQDNPLSDQTQQLIESDLSFRDQQLLKLRDKTPDIEELDGGVSLSEFTLDDFIADLMMFLETRREELLRTPPGIFAVTESGAGAPKGIIWCLKRRDAAPKPRPAKNNGGRGMVSRFAPYYLIYVRADGTIALSFNDDKRLLSTLRAISKGKLEPSEDLCRAWDAQIQNGEEMRGVIASLEAATKEIAGGAKTSALASLASGGKLDSSVVKIDDSLEGWDLISWFIML